MPDTEFALDENGLPTPPVFGAAPARAFEPASAATFEPEHQDASRQPVVAPILRAAPTRRAPAPLPPAGRFNWVLSVLGILTGLASFVWPLLCLTVLVSLGLTAVALSRANRLRRRGATGRGLAVVGLVIGLASAANLVFGFTQFAELSSQLGSLLP